MLHISIVADESLTGGYHLILRAVDYPSPGEAPDSLMVHSSWEQVPPAQGVRDELDQALDTVVAFLTAVRTRPF